MKRSVSCKVFVAVAAWLAANKDESAGLTDDEVRCFETWRDAPESNHWVGRRAIRGGGDRYNRVPESVFQRWLAATGALVVNGTVHSDRTGDHPQTQFAPAKGG